MNSIQVSPLKVSSGTINSQNDIKVFTVFLSYTRCIGVTPFSLQENSFKRIFTKYLVSLLIIVYFTYNFVSFVLKVKHDRFENTFFVFVKTLFYICRTLFIIITLAKANLWNFSNWKRIFNMLEKLDVMMVQFNFEVTRSCCVLYIDTITGIIICVFSRIFHSAVFIYLGEPYGILTMLGWGIFPFYMTSVTTFLYVLAKILHRRYDHMNTVVAGLGRINESRFLLSKIMKIFKVYRILYFLVEEFNCIFGWQIFLCVLSTFVIVVRLLSRIVIDGKLLEINTTIVMILYASIYLVSIVRYH